MKTRQWLFLLLGIVLLGALFTTIGYLKGRAESATPAPAVTYAPMMTAPVTSADGTPSVTYGMYGYGMMSGWGGMMGYNMMDGSWGAPPVEPLSLDEARTILEDFVASQGDDNLTVGEIMVFDNHVYAQIVEQNTGIGAMEVLIDPFTKTVVPEHGPAMMWSLKYNPMGSVAPWMMGVPAAETGYPDPTIDAERAIQLAQAYLDQTFPGTQAVEPMPFYGYYTLHIQRDGEIVGMLSVNAYTGEVFPHTWHGRLITMEEAG